MSRAYSEKEKEEYLGVGYYTDVDGNGTVDGIIFIDLKKGASGSWGDIWFKVSYNISKVSGTKSYKVSQ